jgi:hypothetical protein
MELTFNRRASDGALPQRRIDDGPEQGRVSTERAELTSTRKRVR